MMSCFKGERRNEELDNFSDMCTSQQYTSEIVSPSGHKNLTATSRSSTVMDPSTLWHLNLSLYKEQLHFSFISSYGSQTSKENYIRQTRFNVGQRKLQPRGVNATRFNDTVSEEIVM